MVVNSIDVRALVPLPALTGPELSGTQLTVGDVMRARVVSGGVQGQPVLMLGGATLAMELPFPVTPGQSLDFTVLEVKPEVRLGVMRPAVSPTGSAPADGAGPDLQISPEALLLSRLDANRRRADERPAVPLTTPVPGSETDALLQDPALLATALRQSVDRSGLFYERHQAQWVSGQRSEAALREEPQAAWPSATMRDVAAASGGDLAARLAEAGLDDHAIGLVRQQVDVLQQQALLMRSEVAPGYVLDWQARAEEDGQQRGGDGQARRWETELSSELGSLARVDARLSLAGDRLQLTLRAAPGTLQRMAAARDDLEGALVAAGLQLESLRFAPLATGSPEEPSEGSESLQTDVATQPTAGPDSLNPPADEV
jgi:hypothetical protein